MSTLAIEGISSGFTNTSEMIDAILDVQVRGPIDNLENRIETYTEKLTAFQSLSATLLGVMTSAETLANASVYESKQANSSNTSLVSVAVTSQAETGGFTIGVKNTAKTDQISTDYFSTASEALNLSGEFILNGKRIAVSDTDSLSTIASQINTSNAGVKASTIETAAGQVKMVLTSSSNGVGKIELRDVGTGSLLEDLSLVDGAAETSYDYTVNATASGAISKAFTNLTDVANVSGNFTIRDAGGQYEITLDGANSISATDTVQDIIDKINAAATGTNISAEAVEDTSGEWHIEIRSTTGIPTQFSDPDNVLHGLEIVGGIQSEDFSDTTSAVGSLLNLSSSPSGTFRITGGDAIDLDIAVDLANDSLQDIVDAINAEATAQGSDVTAEIMTVGSENRISISSASGNPIFDPANDTENILKTLGFVDVAFKNYDQQGENAQFTYNGTIVNREDNLVTDLVDGVSIALIAESATEYASISITEDLSEISDLVSSFTTAYNNAMSQINELTYYDGSTGATGILFGDSTVRTIENMLADLVSTRVSKLPGVELSELNDGNGVKLGSINITNRLGVATEVDLSTAKTIEDVLYLINYSTAGVKVEINSSGTGLNVVDESGGVISPLTIEEVGSGTTAEDLGILKQIHSDTLAGRSIYEGGSNTANEFGIELMTGGSIAFDSSAFTAALYDDLDIVRNFFTAEDVGFGNIIAEKMNFLTASGTGLIEARTDGITNSIEQFQESIERVEARSEKLEATLRAKFTAMEVQLAESQQLSDYLSQLSAGSSS